MVNVNQQSNNNSHFFNDLDKDGNNWVSQSELEQWIENAGPVTDENQQQWNQVTALSQHFDEALFANIDPGPKAWHQLSSDDVAIFTQKMGQANGDADQVAADIRAQYHNERGYGVTSEAFAQSVALDRQRYGNIANYRTESVSSSPATPKIPETESDLPTNVQTEGGLPETNTEEQWNQLYQRILDAGIWEPNLGFDSEKDMNQQPIAILLPNGEERIFTDSFSELIDLNGDGIDDQVTITTTKNSLTMRIDYGIGENNNNTNDKTIALETTFTINKESKEVEKIAQYDIDEDAAFDIQINTTFDENFEATELAYEDSNNDNAFSEDEIILSRTLDVTPQLDEDPDLNNHFVALWTALEGDPEGLTLLEGFIQDPSEQNFNLLVQHFESKNLNDHLPAHQALNAIADYFNYDPPY